MKKILLVILSTLLLVVATNTEAKASKGLGMWKEYGKHDFQDFSQFMLDASEGKDLTKYKDWFNCTPKKAYEYSSKYIAFKFPGRSLEQVIAGTEFAQITKEDLEEGTLSYLDTSRQNYMGLLWAKRKDAEILSPKERLGSFEGLEWWDEWCGNLYNGPAPEPREEIVFTPPTKKKSEFTFGGFTQAEPSTNLSYNINDNHNSMSLSNVGSPQINIENKIYLPETAQAAPAPNNNTYVEPTQYAEQPARYVARRVVQENCRVEQLPQQYCYKKPFFNTVGGRALTHGVALLGGYLIGRAVDKNNPEPGWNGNGYREVQAGAPNDGQPVIPYVQPPGNYYRW